MALSKTCSRCGQTKPLDHFNRCARTKDGRRAECQDCQRRDYRRYYANGGREKSRQHAFTHREARLKRWREYAATDAGKAAIRRATGRRGYDPATAPAHRAVHRAIKSGRLVRPQSCELCGRTQALHAHHHNGYDREHYLDVIFACRECHDMLDHGFVIPLRR
jgi:hypothetical protein